MRLEISLFRFDYKSDYLPYYTKHFIKVDKQKNLLDILNTINEKEPFSYEKNECSEIVVNKQFLDCSISCEELVKNFGKDLIIEPISIRRSCSDFIINDDDFKSKLELFTPYLTEDNKQKYLDYKKYFYASNTLGFEKDYIGDAALLFAYDLIKEDKSVEKEILKIIEEHMVGAQYHTSLENRVYNLDSQITEKINAIRELLKITKDEKDQNFAKNRINFPDLKDSCEIKHDFKDFNIAYYSSNRCEKTIEFLDKLKAFKINLKHKKDDLAKQTFHSNSQFTLRVASEILLEAFDGSADFVLVDNENDFYIFDNYQKEMENLCGREIKIPIIHISELQLLASEEYKEARKLLEAHKNNPEII